MDNIWVIVMADMEGLLQALPPSSPVDPPQSEALAACPVCGHGHSSDLDRFEHWLLESGGLRRVTDIGWRGVPLTRPGIWVSGIPLPVSTVSRTIRRTRKILSDLGYVERSPRGRWLTISGRNPIRRISIPEVKEYVDRLYPPRCQPRCTGRTCHCCRVHHIGSWNKVADAFHRLGQYFHYGRTFRDEPSWSHEKLLQLYNVTPTLQYRVPPPSMNPVPKAIAFREWLIHHADVQKQMYGWMVWLGQAFGLRYSEWIAAEWPMEGPRFRVDFAAGKVHVTGKGRLGGKTRSVTITPERERGLRELMSWREALGTTGARAAPRRSASSSRSKAPSGRSRGRGVLREVQGIPRLGRRLGPVPAELEVGVRVPKESQLGLPEMLPERGPREP